MHSQIEQIAEMFEQQDYIADRSIATSVYLAMKLHKPLLVEGPAGVGKTEIAKVVAKALNTDLIRMQCYEGLDAYCALYEWNYQRQLLYLKLDEQSDRSIAEKEARIFSDDFLLKRPILQAITHDKAPVLLIDEIDRADEAFESFLLEVLSDWQITIPEIGTIAAQHIPHVIITSNRTRALSDALRRRCFYLWIDYPTFAKEVAIVRQKVPQIDEHLAQEICAFMQMARHEKLEKPPGVVETLDWACTLALLHRSFLETDVVTEILGVIFKEQRDITHIKNLLPNILHHFENMRKQENKWNEEHIDALLRKSS